MIFKNKKSSLLTDHGVHKQGRTRWLTKTKKKKSGLLLIKNQHLEIPGVSMNLKVKIKWTRAVTHKLHTCFHPEEEEEKKKLLVLVTSCYCQHYDS